MSSPIDLSRWPALVLTAGLATRLHPLSLVRAKAALPVAGEALVIRSLRFLRQSGISRVVLNLHHRPETITREVGDGSQLGLTVRYSWEPEILGSAGGPARALPLLEADRFLIVNGDTLANVDLNALAARHVDTNAAVTMTVVGADPKYNAVIAGDSGIVSALGIRGADAAPGMRAFHFIGFQAVNASAFAGVSVSARSETVHGIYKSMVANRSESIRVMPVDAEFFDIGTPRDYLSTVLRLARLEGRPLDRGAGSAVASGAVIEETVLWDRVTVGAGATLRRCIVTDGVDVPAGARYENCSLVQRNGEMIETTL